MIVVAIFLWCRKPRVVATQIPQDEEMRVEGSPDPEEEEEEKEESEKEEEEETE